MGVFQLGWTYVLGDEDPTLNILLVFCGMQKALDLDGGVLMPAMEKTKVDSL